MASHSQKVWSTNTWEWLGGIPPKKTNMTMEIHQAVFPIETEDVSAIVMLVFRGVHIR